MDEELKIAMEAAVTAGNILLEYRDTSLTVGTKESFRDLVTEADKQAEQIITDVIRSYGDDYCILGEEFGNHIGTNHDKYFIVDPLDGTTNYIHKIPIYCVSIGYVEKDVIINGVVYNPEMEELYYGGINIGSFKNKQHIHVSNDPVENGLFAMSFPNTSYDDKFRESQIDIFNTLHECSCGCLRTGSASLNLAYVAESRLSGCIGMGNRIWDIVAGIALVRGAGGIIHYDEIPSDRHLVKYYAGNKINHTFLEKCLNR